MMWRPLIAVLTVACLAAGCAPGLPQDGVAPSEQKDTRAPARGFLSGLMQPAAPPVPKPLSRVRLARGEVVVSATEGYCVDPETLNARGSGGFAMLASCRILSGNETGPVVPPVLITVTVGPKGSGGALPEAATLAAISEAPLLEGGSGDGLVTARLGSGGQLVLDGGDPRYWRAAFAQNTRLVILALYAPDGSPLTGASGRSLLSEVFGRIRADSPGGAS